MAISSISNYGSTSAMRLPTPNCPTCSGSAARTSTAQAYSGGYAGRGDSYTCATCGTPKAATPKAATTANSANSAYCPTCGGNHARATSFPATAGNTYNCPTCGKGAAGSSASTASRAAASTNNTTVWAR